jgi:hypothetical protein
MNECMVIEMLAVYDLCTCVNREMIKITPWKHMRFIQYG